ncbi:TonB-dependent receptor [Pseudoalteromonas sp. NZS127_1]|uniref:TonB-dependent receptor n=1 Tax=Pseudoalteromonas sp. NZS127_1 TaxID=2792074 RepID=UPI0018CEC000|nr:TonB-dependent receptor [Pseudoalteromonas sp. NZS127_1]MBG9996345.1 TonB-dependent receptor [Pseudoalteromonas sp. NZS127_1]
MKAKFTRTLVHFAVTTAIAATTMNAHSAEEATSTQTQQQIKEPAIERIAVTANRRSQDLQEVSSSITALGEADIARAGIIDVTGLEQVVPGLRMGSSGGEVRPAMRGARTNEVGVAGTGIAEQIVGIFQDGIYVPTTSSGLGALVDVQRIEVLRGPQGTLYGRNTFAGSINIITNQPVFDDLLGSIKVETGSYNRSAYEGIINIPVSDTIATRFVVASDRHDGYINNLVIPGPSDDLREKNQFYMRNVTKWQPNDKFNATVRFDYSRKNSNSEAIWGYQQIAGYQISETSPGSGIFDPNPTITAGHIYQPSDAQHEDLGPYDVYRNSFSLDKQESFSTTVALEWYTDFADIKWTTNYSTLNGKQYYDNDYSDGGIDFVGGFGRVDDQKTLSSELQFASNNDDSDFSWIGGLYYFDQEADWSWLSHADTTGDGVSDSVVVPSWGNPDYDPHTAKSIAAYGQLRYQISEDLRVVGGLRVNQDDKTFTGDTIPDWDDSAMLYKAAAEYDINKDIMVYASVATGYRTGGANDSRVVARGADPLYDNEDVISYEMGMKSYLLDGAMRLNVSVFMNKYEDVKAQLFATSCNDTTTGDTVLECVSAGTATTFEYYENGGDVETKGLEADLQWVPIDNLTLTGTLSLLDSEFADGYAVGNEQLRPLLALGNQGGRQDINDNSSQFSFEGWRPAMAPEYSMGLSARYEFSLGGDSYLVPYIQMNYLDDYYAFDTNIPEVRVDAHLMADARLTWFINDSVQIEAYVKNIGDKAILTRGVVHSQIVDGLPANSVQANWSNPRTWGASLKYQF